MVLPILAVKRGHRNFFDCSRFQTAHVNAVTVWMRSRNIKRFDATSCTKHMLGDPGVECVNGERFGTLDKNEPRFRHDQMEKPALAADRTVAFDRFDRSRSFDLESDTAAMAATAVFDQVNLEACAVMPPLPSVCCTDRCGRRCCIWRGDRKSFVPLGRWQLHLSTLSMPDPVRHAHRKN
jgi:hypothetical protein